MVLLLAPAFSRKVAGIYSTAQVLSCSVVRPSLLPCFGGKGVHRAVNLFLNDYVYAVATWDLCLILGGII